MPEIKFSLSDKDHQRLVDAACSRWEYDLRAQPNETKTEFMMRTLREHIANLTQTEEDMARDESFSNHVETTREEWEKNNPANEQITLT